MLCVLVFASYFLIYAQRINLSIAIDQMMIEVAALSGPGTCGKGFILSSFFIGYVLLQMPGGVVAEKWGAKYVLGVGVLCTSVCTMLTPLAANAGYWWLILLRMLVGLGEAVVFPANNALWSKWAPPAERTLLITWCTAGQLAGSAISLAVSGALCDASGGWQRVFLWFGLPGIIWFMFWVLLTASSPAKHKWISSHECSYIEGAIKKDAAVSLSSSHQALKAMLKSKAVWALIIAHCSQTWGLYTILTELPTFFNNALGLNFAKSGFACALPQVVSFVVTILAGIIADLLRGPGGWSTARVRKTMNIVGIFGSSACLFICGLLATRVSAMMTTFMMTIAAGINGFAYSGYNCNHNDIAPAFAGTLYGVTNTAANLFGLFVPLVVDGIVGSVQGTIAVHLWQHVFLLNLGIAFFGCLSFSIFGRGTPQPWAVDGQRALVGSALVEDDSPGSGEPPVAATPPS